MVALRSDHLEVRTGLSDLTSKGNGHSKREKVCNTSKMQEPSAMVATAEALEGEQLGH